MPISISTEEKLKERIKELTCLYDISTAIIKANSIQETLQEIVKILKVAWRFSEAVIVELKFDNQYLKTDLIPEKTVYQTNNLSVNENIVGFVKIHYPSPQFSQDHFLIDEQKLLNMACLEISAFIEKKINIEKEIILKRSIERVDRLSILGEITAGIAHELNTPLGNILGFAELINEQSTNKQISNDISKIINAAIYSREIVKKLMFFSCEMPQNMELVLIKPIISEALLLLGPNLKKAGISYQLIFEDDTLKAQIDNIQLTQVLFNILLNSIYASPKESIILIHVYNDNENFYIEIRDEGTGIPEEIKPKIFEPFFTTKPIGEGSGLGLSVVHGIIKSHKGDIFATDNQPNGTLFQIRLPLNSKTWS